MVAFKDDVYTLAMEELDTAERHTETSEEGRTQFRKVSAKYLADAFPWSHIPYAELVEVHDPEIAAHKERYLSPSDFKWLFEKSFGIVDLFGFYRMPRWKQRRAKEMAKLTGL